MDPQFLFLVYWTQKLFGLSLIAGSIATAIETEFLPYFPSIMTHLAACVNSTELKGNGEHTHVRLWVRFPIIRKRWSEREINIASVYFLLPG